MDLTAKEGRDREAGTQTERQTGGRQTSRRADRQADKEEDRQTDRQAGGHAGRQWVDSKIRENLNGIVRNKKYDMKSESMELVT